MMTIDPLPEFFEFLEGQLDRWNWCWRSDGVWQYGRPSGKSSVVTFCNGEDVRQHCEKLVSIARHDQSIERVEVYWTGNIDPTFLTASIPDHPPIVSIAVAVEDAWSLWRNLLSERTELGNYIRTRTAGKLRDRFASLDVGDSDKHERLLRRTLQFTLDGCIESVRGQVRSASGASKRDLVIRLKHGAVLREHLRDAGFTANNIIVEAKNTKAPRGEDIRQLSAYLSPRQMATVGILATRQSLTKEMRDRILEDRLTRGEGKSLIIPMDDAFFLKLIDCADVGDFGSSEHSVIDTFDEWIAAVS